MKFKYLSWLILTSLVLIGINLAIHLGKPWDNDSLLYHIPLAENFLKNGNVWPDYHQPFTFYPANIHLLLSIFLLTPIPWVPNLFNVVGLVFLYICSHNLGRRFFKDNSLAYLFATLVITLTPVLRLLNTQMIDIWSLAFFVYGIGFIFKRPDKLESYLMSLALGLFIGAKFNYIFVLLIVFTLFVRKIPNLWQDIKSFIIFLIPASIWYVRNLFLTSNPLYPAEIMSLHLKGDPSINSLTSSFPIKDIFSHPDLFPKVIDALFSDFHIWLLLVPVTMIILFQKRQNLRLLLVGTLISSLYLITPAFLNNVYHDLRYMLPGVVILILSGIDQLKKQTETLLLILLSQSIVAFSFFNYQPKAIIGGLILTFVIYFWEQKRHPRMRMPKYD